MCHVTYQHKAQKANTQSFQLSGLIQFIISLIQYVNIYCINDYRAHIFEHDFRPRFVALIMLWLYTAIYIYNIWNLNVEITPILNAPVT